MISNRRIFNFDKMIERNFDEPDFVKDLYALSKKSGEIHFNFAGQIIGCTLSVDGKQHCLSQEMAVEIKDKEIEFKIIKNEQIP